MGIILFQIKKKGKILFRFPCINEKILEGCYYDIKFCVDYTPYDIKKIIFIKLIKIC